MQKFTSLPVSGDAFLLQREGVNILVDSGPRSRKGKLSDLLVEHAPSMESINIAVCTHADADHAGGYTTLLDDWQRLGRARSRLIDEFWLPAVWDDIVTLLTRSCAKPPNTLVDIINEEMEDLYRRYQGLDSVSAIEAAMEDRWGEFESRRISERPSSEALQNRSEEVLASRRQVQLDLRAARRQVTKRVQALKVNKTLGQYWIGLIGAALRIHEIVVSAIRHKVKIRWFDYRLYENNWIPYGGCPILLVPTNAVEVSRTFFPPASHVSILFKLTIQNEQCLSFFASNLGWWHYPVLFCGDSPMGAIDANGNPISFRPPLPLDHQSIVATAPHHGSDSHEDAYGFIELWNAGCRMDWIRSGGQKRKHPGERYQRIPQCRRSCTYCPHKDDDPKHPVVVVQRKFWWRRILKKHACNCKPN